MELTSLVFAGGAALLAAVLVVSLLHLYRWTRDRRRGELVGVDDGIHSHRPLRSARYGLIGRPDELRQRSDGRLVPIEWKSRRAPHTGPPLSHRIQVAAYCLLIEEEGGRPPPYGILRYGDATEVRIPWNESARREVLALLDEVRRPYRGAARPGVAKCLACRWRAGCDARAH